MWDLKPHTRAKHAILRRYLDAWFPIMSRYNRRIVFFDGFAGPGIYSHDEPGSPRIALDALIDHKYAEGMSSCEFVFLFNEAEAERFGSLKSIVEEMQATPAFPTNVKIILEQGSFESTSEALISRLEERGAKLAPTFAFVDPFGYAGIPMSTLKRLLSFDKCELLLYLDINSLIRFGTSGQVDGAITGLMGTELYKDAPPSGQARQTFMRDLYEQQLRDNCGFTYTHSFLMRGNNNKPICYLVYATRALVGLSAMKEAMWKVAPTGDYSFSDGDADQEVLFGEDVDTSQLRRRLMETFSGQTVSIEQVEDFTIAQTPFLKSHVKVKTLKPMEDDGAISGSPPNGKKRRPGTYAPGTMVTFLS